MVKIMQQTFLETSLRAWLLVVINQLMALLGLQVVTMDAELVRDGWRQIPDGHQSFDPALADYFRTQKMRNGKHINLAVSYSVVAKWNASNKRRGQAEWTYGSDRHYADKYTDVDRKTWGQHMDDLAALGLVEVSQMKGKPAYRVIPYQILNDQLTISHAQGYGHDAQKAALDAQGYAHDAHPITESFNKETSEKRNYQKTSSTPARAAGDDDPPTQPSRDLDKVKPETPEVRPAVASDEGEDELLKERPPANLPRPIPPSSAAPPFPDDTTAQNSTLDEVGEATEPDITEELQAFFTGCTVDQVQEMIAKHGRPKILETIKAAVNQPNATNPPGLVRFQLGYGRGGVWRLPKLVPDRPRDDEHDPQSMAEWLAGRQTG